MSAPAVCEEAGVGVGVVLGRMSGDEECVVLSEDGRGLIYTSGKNQEVSSYSFDRVVTVDDIQSLHAELLQRLPDTIAAGYNGALLMCGVPASGQDPALIDHGVVKKLLTHVFSRVSTQAKEEDLFVSVSSIQFHPDGSAVDVLGPNEHNLTLLQHPVPGSLIGGVSEVCVCSEAEAYSLYETCREMMLRATPGSISSRCSSLFSVTVEWKLDPEEAESEVQRCRLQLFSLAGGASRTDLRGVNPLVKAVDQISRGATKSEQLLQLLLHQALTGNCRSALIYCINPQGLLDDETPSALALAQQVRALGNRATVGRWSPRAAEREIRGKITELQREMMSHGGSEDKRTQRLAELTQHLQIVKNQSWEKRREESKRIRSEAQSRQTHKQNSSHHGEDTEKCLQDQLRLEMMEHIREGKMSVEKLQERIGRVQELREALREESLRNGAVTEKSDLCPQPLLEHNKAEERRRRLKEDHARLIQQEVEKMERDLAQEQLPAEGPQRELLLLTRERQVLVLQMEALRAEALLAERDLQEQHNRHQGELCCLRGESLQVFRAFRQVSEEQRRMSEGRYRSVLLEAVHDAVHLSAQNQQLQAENKQLHKALGELKDALAVRTDPNAKP